jgi:hypothetical protein
MDYLIYPRKKGPLKFRRSWTNLSNEPIKSCFPYMRNMQARILKMGTSTFSIAVSTFSFNRVASNGSVPIWVFSFRYFVFSIFSLLLLILIEIKINFNQLINYFKRRYRWIILQFVPFVFELRCQIFRLFVLFKRW